LKEAEEKASDGRREAQNVSRDLEPGVSVARVAQRHAINANQLLLWRKLYREGLLGCWEKTAIV
jgi:transposase-like protein